MARHKRYMAAACPGLGQGVTSCGDLCVVPPPWGCFPPPPQPGTGDDHKQTDLVLQTRLLPHSTILKSLNPVLKFPRKPSTH